jgi:hypothetical protein
MSYETSSGLELLAPYAHSSGLQAVRVIAVLHTSELTVTHALGFSVFISLILATEFNSLTVT